MKATERFLRRATRGLWGQKRYDAMMELRGAIEDKVYRHRLLGLSEREAEQAALRDLGNPAVIARGLGRVHTGPVALRFALLAGVMGLLGFQAVAQVPVVRATGGSLTAINCTFDDTYLNTLPEEAASGIRQQLTLPGEREKLVADCLQSRPQRGNLLLRLADVWAAFRGSGIVVEQFQGSSGLYNVTFPGQPTPRLIDLGQSVLFVGGEKYVHLHAIVSVLISRTDAALTLTGTLNPTLRVGPANLQLGTPAAPVRASDVYMAALLSPLELKTGQNLAFQSVNRVDPTRFYRYRVTVPDGTQYAVLDNQNFLCDCMLHGLAPRYVVSVQEAQGGHVSSTIPISADEAAPQLVSTLTELKAATTASRRAQLVYRLNGNDLRNVVTMPVPASALRLVTVPKGN